MSKWFWAIIILLALILCPTDAIILWVQHPNPLWENIVQMLASILTDTAIIFYLYMVAARNEKVATARE